MTPDFDHVLLTRFSAVVSEDGEPAGEDWLYYRLGFFIDATLPSVASQTTRDFTWLVLFDDRCSDTFRADVEELAAGHFTPVWTHERFRRDLFAAPVAAVAAAPWLITTRIDSDDAMARDFMASVQAQFARQDRLFVNFTRGVQIDRSGAVYLTDMLSSPFLSLIERRTDAAPDTVYVAKHARARAHGPIREVRAPVMWAQVVHDLNVSNIVTGTRTDPAVVARRFDFHLGYDAGVSGTRLARARLADAARLGRLWRRHPGELTRFVEARAWRLRGTHERAQDDGATLSDGVQEALERWKASDARAALRRGYWWVAGRRWALRTRLNQAGSQALTPIAGDPDAVVSADRVAVIAEFSTSTGLRAEAVALARELARTGYRCLVVAARNRGVGVHAPDDLPAGVAVVRRRNVAYDFGSWAAALAEYPALAGRPSVLLTNDSLHGPFAPLADLVGRFEGCGTDVWAATRIDAPRPHLQSFLLGFRGGVLGREELRAFFAGVRPTTSKVDVVKQYELGLSQVVEASGLTWSVGWPNAALGLAPNVDPTMGGWAVLLQGGFPFVKRRLLSADGPGIPRASVLAAVQGRYGEIPDLPR